MVILRLFLLLTWSSLAACVYFNTYYNARKHFQQAERLRQEHEQKQLGIAEEQRRPSTAANRLYDQAARKSSRILEQHKESDLVDDAMFLLGRAFYWQGDYLSAARTFEELERNFPDGPFLDRSRYWRGLCYEGQRAKSDARSIYRTMMSVGSGELASKAGYRLGEMAFAEENYAAAIQEFQETLEAFPGAEVRSALWLRLGEAIFALGDTTRYGEALSALGEVRKEDPSKLEEYRARLISGRVEYALGNEEEALRTYEKLLKEGRFRPFEGQTRLQIGKHYLDLGLVDEALGEFEQVRDDFPNSPSSAMALYRTALVHLQEYGDLVLAREYLLEVGREKRDSEAALLAQETTAYMTQLDRLVYRVHRADSLLADSLATLADSLALGVEVTAGDSVAGALGDTLADSLAAGVEVVAGDSAAGAPEDTMAITRGRAPHPDSLLLEAADGAGPGDAAPEMEGAGSPPTGMRKVGTLQGSAAGSDTEGKSPDWFFNKGDSSKGESPARTVEIFDDLFEIAELYRGRLAQPDSSLRYYQEVARRFPTSVQLPRILYSMAWVHLELKENLEGARPYLERLIEEYPASDHANAARSYLGLEEWQTAEEKAAARFVDIEALRTRDVEALDLYVPLLDSLSRQYPDAPTAAKAAYLAASSYENAGGDSTEAERRYERLLRDFPESPFARLVEERRTSLEDGLLVKLERGLKSVGGQLGPGEHVEVIAVEPDSLDSIALGRKYFGFALRAHRRGDLDRAGEFYELSLEEQGKNSEAHYQLGNIQWDSGYYQDALDFYRSALRFDIHFLKAHYRLYYSHTANGMADSANYYLQQIIGKDRGNDQVKYILEEYPDLRQAPPEELSLGALEDLELDPPEEDLFATPEVLRLQEYPLVRKVALPAYPPSAGGDSAVVNLDVLVGRDGRPETVEVFEGDEPFAQAALEAARNYQFFPGESMDRVPYQDEDERRVRVWVELVLPFKPPGETVSRREESAALMRKAEAESAAPVPASMTGGPARPEGAGEDPAASADTLSAAGLPAPEAAGAGE